MSAATVFSQKLVGVAAEQLAKFGRDTPGITLAVLSSSDGFEEVTGTSVSAPALAPEQQPSNPASAIDCKKDSFIRSAF